MHARLLTVMAAWLSLVTLGCADGESSGANRLDAGSDTSNTGTGDASEAPQGRALYDEPLADGNTFACATCHALSEPAPDGLRRPGHPIGEAANRATYKNGQLTDLRDAVNTCATEWMRAVPFEADDPRWIALSGFLQEQAGDRDAAPIASDIVAPPEDLSGGDAVAGMQTFDGSCAVCHAAGAAGSQLAPPLVGSNLDEATVAERIRQSGATDSAVYEGLTGGVMPFWSADRVSDEELLDLVAYVVEIGAADRREVTNATMGDDDESGQGPSSDPDDESNPNGSADCGDDHPLVGASAELSTFAHRVAGTVRVVDNCTLVLENFSFDGGGVRVEVYAGVDGDFDPPVGVSISDNLLGMVFDGGELTLRLPEGVSLDDFNGISIWCVPIGADFGSATFPEPT